MGDLYINVWEVCDFKHCYFHILQGGRGTGKTYSALCGVEGLTPLPFGFEGKYILLRRTQEECDTIASGSSTMNPFKKINKDHGTEISCKKINKKVTGIYKDLECSGEPHGYIMALSTFASIRSVDFSDVTVIIMDEFIPEKHVRMLPDEGDAYLNCYETVCRNREFYGELAVHMLWMANSNNIYNPLLVELHIINDIERLAKNKGSGVLRYPDRGLEFHLLETPEEFKTMKAKTALGRLTAGTRFAEMAIENRYAYNDFSLTGYRKLKHYSPLFSIDNIYVYRNQDSFYACYAKGDVFESYKSSNSHDRMAAARRWRGTFIDFYSAGQFFFETYQIKHMLLKILLDM